MKKYLCLVLVFLLCVSFVACNGVSNDATKGKDKDTNTTENHGSNSLTANKDFFEWSTIDETVITGYSESGRKQTELLIPADCTKVTGLDGNDTIKYVEFEGADTKIAAFAFSKCSNLQTVKLPDNLQIMERSIFSECTGLKSISIPQSVTEIRSNVFWLCESLESIELSDNISKLGDEVFQGCASLKKIRIPDDVATIEVFTFKDCTALKEVTFGSGLQTIGESAFENCASLKTLTIPEGVTTLESYAFGYCDSLESIYLPASIEEADISCLAQAHNLTVYVVKDSYMDSSFELLMGQDFLEKAYHN